MEQYIINLALALATNELLHNIFEIKGMRAKVKRLQAYIDKKSYKEMSIKIDTRAKSYTISIVLFIVLVSALFGVYTLLDLNTQSALVVIVSLLVATYFFTAFEVDRYHVDIEKITKKFKK